MAKTLARAIYTYILITIILLYSLYDYDYVNFYLIFYVLSYYYIFYKIIKHASNDGLFSLGLLFNLFGLLYTNFFIAECISSNVIISENSYYAMLLSYLAIISFNVVYDLSEKKYGIQDSKIKHVLNLKKFNTGLILLFLISVLSFLFIIRQIGFNLYLESTRAEKSMLRSSYSWMLFFPYTFPLVSFLSLYIFLAYRKKINLLIFIVSFAFSILNAIFSASRGDMLSVILPILYLLNHHRVISNRFSIVIGLLGFLFFGIWKSLYYNEIVIQYDSEFVTWYKISDKIFSDSNGIKYLYGRSYIETLINLIIPVTNTESLSTWYVKKYELDVFMSGGGRGFPAVIEAFLNFNLFGVIIIYGMYGLLFKKINGKSELGIFISMIVMVSVYKFFRAPAYSLWKNMMWFQIYPTLLLYFISRVRR